jgi:hypothetical protein
MLMTEIRDINDLGVFMHNNCPFLVKLFIFIFISLNYFVEAILWNLFRRKN